MKAVDLKCALKRRQELPDGVLMFELPSAIGGGSRRFADAVAMCTVPSQGLSLHGFEIKISKQDLKHELAEINKADGVGRYCDFWWIVTPQKVCDAGELPLNWGLLECFNGELYEVKAAKLNEPEIYDRVFIASLTRRIEPMEEGLIEDLIYTRLQPLRRRIEYLEQEMKATREQRLERQHKELFRLRSNIIDFEKRSGLNLSRPQKAAEIANIAALIRKSRLFESYGPLDRLETLSDEGRKQIAKLKTEIAILELPLRKATQNG